MRRELNFSFNKSHLTNYLPLADDQSAPLAAYLVNVKLVNNLLIGKWKLINALCASWVQHVHALGVHCARNGKLSADRLARLLVVGYKPRALHTRKPRLTRPLLPSDSSGFTVVTKPFMPTVHTTNKNNDKVNYFKNYLLLIPARRLV